MDVFPFSELGADKLVVVVADVNGLLHLYFANSDVSGYCFLSGDLLHKVWRNTQA